MTERFYMALPGYEQELEVALPTLENEDVVFTIVTRRSEFNIHNFQIIVNCQGQNAGEDYIQMGELIDVKSDEGGSYGFDFHTDDLGTIHLEVEFMERKTFITVSF